MSLDSLRKVRAQTVESLTMELAQITQALVRGEERYRTIETELQADAESYAQHTVHGLTIEALLEWQGRLDARRAALLQLRHELDQATSSWQRSKERLVEASQECKLLDRIAENRREAARVDADRHEQRAMDEAANRRPAAGGQSGS